MVDVVAKAAPWVSTQIFSYIALFAVSNTVLLNFITSSRLMLGMSRQGLLPGFLKSISPKRQSPHFAILLIGAVLLTLAILGNLTTLAKATSIMLLTSFMVVNVSLIVLQRKEKIEGAFEVHPLIPMGGTLLSALLLIQAEKAAWIVACSVFLVIGLMYAILRPKLDQTAQSPIES